MQLIHKLQTKAEQDITKQIVSDVKRVDGKFDILYILANTALNNPEGIIQDKIYPEVSESTLKNLVQELGNKGKWYDTQVNNKIRSLYSHASRKPLLALLSAFDLKTNLNQSKRILAALEVINRYKDIKGKYFPNTDEIPIENIIPNEWVHLVVENVEDTDAKKLSLKINRMSYEIAVLQALCRQISCKMIWIEGAYRYQNPDKELPQDFDENRAYYYNLLGLPLNVKDFIEPRKLNLHNHLTKLDKNILHNKKVSITKKHGGRIKISPSEPQIEPPNIKKLHRAIRQSWGMINLIDILKETDLQIEFTQQFQSVASREHLLKETLQQRLLLCLYAIGTNTGLKPISAANGNVTYSDLRYVKRRFITPENVKAAIVDIINRILAVRDPRVWGETTTGVACDSKKLSVWDQNLMVEWHTRYRGRGVMIYWHVDKQSLCIHSQLKTCSSSEVGAMFKGILQHCTDMIIDKAYMDTHGQSTLGFGVGELLNFSLLPRLKNIDEQKLYYPSSKEKSDYKNIQDILKGVINWKLIEENYNEAVKHIVALKLGMLEPEVFIKRFSKDNYQHPIYKTLVEIGKISKTIFLCNYLMSEELRIEIHESQNIVERVNSIMSFIFYGKLGEISTNIKTEQELSIFSLHLLQACMAYINTLLIQNELSKSEWQNQLTLEDKRALNVLMHSYINPYGLFPLDLSERLGITSDPHNSNRASQTKKTPTKNQQTEVAV